MAFVEAIKDYDGYGPNPEAIKIFNNPFSEEHQFDANENHYQGVQLPGASPRITKKTPKKKLRENIITGSYKQDIPCLMEAEMIDEFISIDNKFDKILKRVILQNKNKNAEEKLLIKFQIYMLL